MPDVTAAPVSQPDQPPQSSPQPNSHGKINAEQEVPANPFKGTKHKYKAMGREVEVDYDELIARASKADGADAKLRQAAELRKKTDADLSHYKKIEERFNRLKDPSAEDFDDLVEIMGEEKARKIAEKLVWKQIEWDELSPEKQDAIKEKRRADDAEKKLKSRDEQEAEKVRLVNQKKAYQIIDKEIGDAIAEAKADGISVADMPEMIEGVVDEMIAFLEYVEDCEEKGIRISRPPPSPKDVIRKLQSRYDDRSTAYLSRLPIDKIKSMLSKEQLAAIRQSEVDQLYAPIPKSGTQQQKPDKDAIDPFAAEKPTKKNNRRMKSDQWFAAMEKKIGR